MFALYVAHYTQTTSVNNALLSPEPVQIIAIEPIQANFSLLQQNMQLHHMHGRAYCCAIGDTSSVTSHEESVNAAALTRLSSEVVDGSGQSLEKEDSELSLYAKVRATYVLLFCQLHFCLPPLVLCRRCCIIPVCLGTLAASPVWQLTQLCKRRI